MLDRPGVLMTSLIDGSFLCLLLTVVCVVDERSVSSISDVVFWVWVWVLVCGNLGLGIELWGEKTGLAELLCGEVNGLDALLCGEETGLNHRTGLFRSSRL